MSLFRCLSFMKRLSSLLSFALCTVWRAGFQGSVAARPSSMAKPPRPAFSLAVEPPSEASSSGLSPEELLQAVPHDGHVFLDQVSESEFQVTHVFTAERRKLQGTGWSLEWGVDGFCAACRQGDDMMADDGIEGAEVVLLEELFDRRLMRSAAGEHFIINKGGRTSLDLARTKHRMCTVELLSPCKAPPRVQHLCLYLPARVRLQDVLGHSLHLWCAGLQSEERDAIALGGFLSQVVGIACRHPLGRGCRSFGGRHPNQR